MASLCRKYRYPIYYFVRAKVGRERADSDPPNIVVSTALSREGLEPFSFFEFTPIGLRGIGSDSLSRSPSSFGTPASSS